MRKSNDQTTETMTIPKSQPRIIIDSIDAVLESEFGTELCYLKDETIPIALIHFEGDYTYSTLLYFTSNGPDGLPLPVDHLRCLISPVVIYTDGDTVVDIADEGGSYDDELTVQVSVDNIPNFRNYDANMTAMVTGILRAIANTPHRMANGAWRERFASIRKLVIDTEGCKAMDYPYLFDNPSNQNATNHDQQAEELK